MKSSFVHHCGVLGLGNRRSLLPFFPPCNIIRRKKITYNSQHCGFQDSHHLFYPFCHLWRSQQDGVVVLFLAITSLLFFLFNHVLPSISWNFICQEQEVSGVYDFLFSIVQAMTGCSTDGISLFILNTLELLIKDSFSPVWTTPSVLVSWTSAMSSYPRLATACRQTTFWNTNTLKEKSEGFFSLLFLFCFFFTLFSASHVQLRVLYLTSAAFCRRFFLNLPCVSQNWFFFFS